MSEERVIYRAWPIEFEVGDKVMHKLYDSTYLYEIVYKGHNYVTVKNILSDKPDAHPVRLYEKEIDQLRKI